ncbi:unnamed protein product [Owenia fusiformis]|uniref:BK channel n=1 Tax=Owenia fusiformis TaxID=6347 RepID=A0A8J1T6U9_OWEFU|nr:unnamed protein product [Owenia fusiformis]
MELNTSYSFNETQTSGTVILCKGSGQWFLFLSSSIVTFVIGLFAILIFRLVRYATYRTPNQRILLTPKDRTSSEDISSRGSRTSPQEKIKLYDGLSNSTRRNGCTDCIWLRIQEKTRDIASGQTLAGKLVVTMSTVASTLSFILYLIDATRYGEDSYLHLETCTPFFQNPTQIIDFILNLYLLAYFVLRFIAASNRLLFWVQLFSFVDYFTIPCGFVGVVLGRNWLGLRFTRVMIIYQIPNVLQQWNLLTNSRNIKKAKFFMLFLSVWVGSAGFVHLVENAGGHKLTYWDCVYFLIVSMSTVGYGDISCRTTLGKIFIVIFIVSAIALFTSVLPELVELISSRNKYGGTYKKKYDRHVVVCGHITYETVSRFLRDFLHGDREVKDINIVFLSKKHPDVELKALIKSQFTYVKYYQGNAINAADLERVKLKECDACLVLTNKQCIDPDAEDAANIMRVIAVKDYCEKTRMIVQLMLHRNKNHLVNIAGWHMGRDEVICMSELEMAFIAQSCIAPGISTMMANLFMMISTKDSGDCPEWKKQFIQGADLEIYMVPLSDTFVGTPFPAIAEICYKELGILLIGVEIKKLYGTEILLNPNSRVAITTDVKAILLANTLDEAKKVTDYGCSVNRFIGSLHSVTVTTTSVTSNKIDGEDKNENSKASEQIAHRQTSEIEPRPLDHDITTKSTENPCEATEELFDITGMFHWCQRRTIDEANLLDSQNKHSLSNMNGHIVVCLLAKADSPQIGLANFVKPLRASNWRRHELKDILIIGRLEYIKQEWATLQNFPNVYFIEGDPLARTLLRMGKVNHCRMCVALAAPTRNIHDDPLLQDKEVLLCTLNIKKMLFSATKKLSIKDADSTFLEEMQSWTVQGSQIVPILTKLENDSAVQFLEQDDDEDESEEFYMTKAFACGRVFAVSVLDSLMSAIYFNKNVLNLIDSLITGGSIPELDLVLAEGVGMLPGSRKNIEDRRNRCRITQVSFDDEPLQQFNITEMGSSYGSLVLWALKKHGILCLGLYRLLNNNNNISSSEVKHKRYVVTNPPMDFMLYKSDRVYCIEPYYKQQHETRK